MALIPIHQRATVQAAQIKRDLLRHKVLNAKTLDEVKTALLHYIEELLHYDKS